MQHLEASCLWNLQFFITLLEIGQWIQQLLAGCGEWKEGRQDTDLSVITKPHVHEKTGLKITSSGRLGPMAGYAQLDGGPKNSDLSAGVFHHH